MDTYRRGVWACVFTGLVWVVSQAGAAEKAEWTFDKDETGALPRGFVTAVGHWRVVEYEHAKVLAQFAQIPTRSSTSSSSTGTMHRTLTSQ